MKLLFAIVLIAPLFLCNAEVRYVSKTGNSTPPYTSPETASDSINKCLDIANHNDTIYIEKGTYIERLEITKKLFLSGSGADSTILQFNSDHSVIYYDDFSGGIVEGLSIINSSTSSSNAIFTSMKIDDTLIVRDCKLFSKSSNISHGDGHVVAYNNYGRGSSLIFTLSGHSYSTIFVYNNIGLMDFYISTFNTHATIINNLFYAKERIIHLQNNAPHLVANNICISEYTSSSNSTGTGVKGLGVTFLNNLVSGYFEWGGLGLQLHGVI